MWETWSSPQGSTALWVASMVGVLLTALYIFRVIFLVFFGEANTHVAKRPGFKIQIPLVVLASSRSWADLLISRLMLGNVLVHAPIANGLAAC